MTANISGNTVQPQSRRRRFLPGVLRSLAVPAFVVSASLLPLAAFAAAESSATPVANSPFDTGNVLRIAIGLMVVVVAIVASAWALRRWGNYRSTSQGELQIIGGLSMGPRERLVLVQVGDEQLLLGVAPGRIQTLHKLERPVAAAAANNSPASGSFAEKMRAALGQGGRS